MSVRALLDVIRDYGNRDAIIAPSRRASYAELLTAVEAASAVLDREAIARGTVVALPALLSLEAVAMLLALAERGAIAVPLPPMEGEALERCAIAQVAVRLHPTPADEWQFTRHEAADHPLYARLRQLGEAAIVLFSSGSTGAPKAAVLGLDRLTARHRPSGKDLRTLGFMLPDHIGGLNTLLFTLTNGAALATPPSRSPHAIARTIALHNVELLPATPTFLNLLLMSGALKHHDLISLTLITYGTECMPQATLSALAESLPWVRIKQTYGSTEMGILPTRSIADDSLWMEIPKDRVELRIVKGIAHLRGPTAMEGYLNAASPFDADGWLDTGDLAEEHDGQLRILGRQSEVINVGGDKVLPSEVESVLLQAANVSDAVVRGRHNAVTGQIVTAKVATLTPEAPDALEQRLRRFCAVHLAEHKIPALIEWTSGPLHGPRFKRLRSGE
jgi:long-chain acyl-CoA synthetase